MKCPFTTFARRHPVWSSKPRQFEVHASMAMKWPKNDVRSWIHWSEKHGSSVSKFSSSQLKFSRKRKFTKPQSQTKRSQVPWLSWATRKCLKQLPGVLWNSTCVGMKCETKFVDVHRRKTGSWRKSKQKHHLKRVRFLGDAWLHP